MYWYIYKFIYVYIYIYLYIHVFVCIYICAYLYINTYTYIYTFIDSACLKLSINLWKESTHVYKNNVILQVYMENRKGFTNGLFS